MRSRSVIAILILTVARLNAAESYKPVPPPADPSALGTGVQRTMTLLATSTPERPNHVRILFYGQSITEQDWWKRVVADLQARFPSAKIQAENRAIGGFASQLLIRPAEHDLYPFYPDLLIFHVYGADGEYESIIRTVRTRTAAEVLMQRDHLTHWAPAEFSEKLNKGDWWDDRMNNKRLPEIARKYDCGLCDVRRGWVDYLKAHQLEPKALLKDGVHLNDHGNYLMAALVGRHLIYRPELPDAAWKELAVTTPITAAGGVAKLEFDGNRVDLIPSDHGKGGAVKVIIDGKPPSEWPGCYAITRPHPWPWSTLFLSRVDHEKPLVAEEWTATVKSVTSEGKAWTYEVRGSVTGPDGEGRSDKPFVSKSGRVKIAPEAWFRPKDAVPVGYVVRWKSVLMGADEPRLNADDVTAAQGFPNGRHTLELTASDAGTFPVGAVRVYRPPVR